MAILHPAFLVAVTQERDPMLIVTAEGRTSDKPCMGDICTPADFYDWANTADVWSNIAYAVLGPEKGKYFPIWRQHLANISEGQSDFGKLTQEALALAREASSAVYTVANGKNYEIDPTWAEQAASIKGGEDAISKADGALTETIEALKSQAGEVVKDVENKIEDVVEDIKKKKTTQAIMIGGGILLVGGIIWWSTRRKSNY